MIFKLESVILRKAEPEDLERLYSQKNDPEVADLLGGYSAGYSRKDIQDWMEFHRRREDEVLWIIADAKDNQCLGHVGLYKIDHRVRSAEFAIMIGDKSQWSRGLGSAVTRFVVGYGFQMLNLNRISLNVLKTNPRAIELYRKIGFQEEGLLRRAQFKHGNYVDVLLMSFLRDEYRDPWP